MVVEVLLFFFFYFFLYQLLKSIVYWNHPVYLDRELANPRTAMKPSFLFLFLFFYNTSSSYI